MSHDPLLKDFLTRPELAEELKVTVRTLTRWHWSRKGPPSVRIAGRRLYRRAEVAAWIESCK